jgi:hypothetical protein
VKVSSLVFACYSKACAPPPVGSGGSKGGSGKGGNKYAKLLDGTETVPLRAIGIKPAQGKRRHLAETTRDDDALWAKAKTMKVSANDRFIGIEDAVKTRHVAKVVMGREPLRPGYNPRLYKLPEGGYMIADGHTRLAMHKMMGSKAFDVEVLPLPENF